MTTRSPSRTPSPSKALSPVPVKSRSVSQPSLRKGSQRPTPIRLPEHRERRLKAGTKNGERRATIKESTDNIRTKTQVTTSTQADTELRKKTISTIMELENLGKSLGSNREQEPAARRSVRLPMVVLFLFVFAAVVSALLLLLTTRRHTAALTVRPVCATLDCVEHAATLRGHLNRSLKPCDDFSRFVCSGWESDFEYSSSIDESMHWRWNNRTTAVLSGNHTHFNVTGKAIALFEACRNRTQEEKNAAESIARFKAFMRQRNIPWPNAPPSDIHPLEVLFELSVNWRVDMWFKVLVRSRPDGTNLIVIRPDHRSTFWLALIKDIEGKWKETKNREEYCMQFYNVFRNESRPREYVRRLLQVEKEVMLLLRNAILSRKRKSVTLTFEDVERVTTSIRTPVWLNVLNKIFRPTYSFTEKDEVVCNSAVFLETINKIFVTYSNAEILDHLGWWFVQIYSDLSTNIANVFKWGSVTSAQYLSKSNCAIKVEYMYSLLLASEYAALQFSPGDRNRVDGMLNSVANQAIYQMNNSVWIDEVTKVHARRKLKKVKHSLWPTALVEDKVNKIYDSFPDSATRFMELWLGAAEATRGLLGHPHYDELVSAKNNVWDPYFSYDYISNTVSVSVAGVDRPLYYKNGTPAVNFGGLGAAFARQFMKALDTEGIQLDAQGHRRPWWSGSTKPMYDTKAACTGPERSGIFPDVPAIEVAYSAYKQFLNETTGDVMGSSLKMLEEFNSDHVFFMTYCYYFCKGPGYSDPTDLCNKAMKNFDPFAEAFACPVGSAMNPARKCSFFYS